MVEYIIQFKSTSITKSLTANKTLSKIKIQTVLVLDTWCGTGGMYRHATPGSTISVQILPGKRPELFSIKSLPQQLVSALTISGLSTSVGWIEENEPKKRLCFGTC